MRRTEHGSALILALSLLVIVAIFLTGFVTMARFERTSAADHLSGVKALAIANMGANIAAAKIATGTVADNFWTSQPGALVVVEKGSTEPLVIDLSSGVAPSSDEHAGIDLNAPSIISNQGSIIADQDKVMNVGWIYIREDGTLEKATASPPAYSQSNPVVGRYAFWTDDEGCKINLNTALSREGSSLAISHPSRIDLRVIDGISAADIDKLSDFRITEHLLDTLKEATRVGSDGLSDAVTHEKFSLTHYNHSPDQNAFNTSRISLTTREALAGDQPFLDILKTPNSDPGLLSNLDNGKVRAAFNSIYTYLKRTDWPFMPQESFVDKYGTFGAAQIALDIIEHVRSSESSSVIIEPIRASLSAEGVLTVNPSSLQMMGNPRKLYITQIGVAVSNKGTTWNLDYHIEVYLPPFQGDQRLKLSDYGLYCKFATGDSGIRVGINPSWVQGSDETIGQGECRTVVYPRSTGSAPPSELELRVGIYDLATNNFVDIAPLNNEYISYPFQVPTPAIPYAVSVDDPLINKHRKYWKLGDHKFNRTDLSDRTGASTVGNPSSVVPQQDTNGSGAITSVGYRVPAPDESFGSVGNLGSIHTGLTEVSSSPPDGTPWRTIRLQPTNGSTTLPDWLILDLFSTSIQYQTEREKSVLNPRSGTKGGLININAPILPFKNSDIVISRLLPLQGLFYGVSNGSQAIDAESAMSIGENISDKMAATGTNDGRWYASDHESLKFNFQYIGQLAEVRGISDAGEASESVMREIAGLVSVRSNVFTIYSVGQSIAQLKNGEIVVRAERRLATAIERKGTGGSRVLFQKDIDL